MGLDSSRNLQMQSKIEIGRTRSMLLKTLQMFWYGLFWNSSFASEFQDQSKLSTIWNFSYLLGGGTIWGKWGSWTVNAFLLRIFLGGGLSPMARSDKSVARPFIWLEDKEWKYVVGDTWFRPPVVVCSDISERMESHTLTEIKISWLRNIEMAPNWKQKIKYIYFLRQ